MNPKKELLCSLWVSPKLLNPSALNCVTRVESLGFRGPSGRGVLSKELGFTDTVICVYIYICIYRCRITVRYIYTMH